MSKTRRIVFWTCAPLAVAAALIAGVTSISTLWSAILFLAAIGSVATTLQPGERVAGEKLTMFAVLIIVNFFVLAGVILKPPFP